MFPFVLWFLGLVLPVLSFAIPPDPYVFVLHAELVKFNYLLITGISQQQECFAASLCRLQCVKDNSMCLGPSREDLF